VKGFDEVLDESGKRNKNSHDPIEVFLLRTAMAKR
jgi:hypothetical protein